MSQLSNEILSVLSLVPISIIFVLASIGLAYISSLAVWAGKTAVYYAKNKTLPKSYEQLKIEQLESQFIDCKQERNLLRNQAQSGLTKIIEKLTE